MAKSSRPTLSDLLARIERGDEFASDELLPFVYDDMRRFARVLMARERANTPQPTELVHQAYLRLGGDRNAAWKNRAHFFAAAAEAMRRILLERARRRGRVRHGGDRERVPLSRASVRWDIDPAELIDLHDALTKLESLETRVAQVVKLRYFAGLTVEETAAALGISTRTVKRDWARARHWLYRQIVRKGEAPSG